LETLVGTEKHKCFSKVREYELYPIYPIRKGRSKYQKETRVELRDINIISLENLGLFANLKYTKSYI
jgi:hypothetical protein